MSYIDGFVIAVPTANRRRFIEHARQGDSVFIDLGATRVVKCWGDDVPEGEVTDFRKAVRAEEDETVVFSWIEWPDKATRDAAMAKMTDGMNNPERADPRLDSEKNPMPFDGTRLISGGFTPIVEVGVSRHGREMRVHPSYVRNSSICKVQVVGFAAGSTSGGNLRCKNPDHGRVARCLWAGAGPRAKLAANVRNAAAVWERKWHRCCTHDEWPRSVPLLQQS